VHAVPAAFEPEDDRDDEHDDRHGGHVSRAGRERQASRAEPRLGVTKFLIEKAETEERGGNAEQRKEQHRTDGHWHPPFAESFDGIGHGNDRAGIGQQFTFAV
jgi:hypothetical protein